MPFITYESLGLTPPTPSVELTEGVSDMLAIAHGFMVAWEGFEPVAYPDPATGSDPITCGAGLTYKPDGSKFKLGETFTKQELEAMYDTIVKRDFLPPLTQIPHWDEMKPCQQAALLSFAWNNGAAFYGDTSGFNTITQVLASKQWSEVPAALALYRKGNGQVMLGLQRRRHSEGLLWQGATPQNAYEKASVMTSGFLC